LFIFFPGWRLPEDQKKQFMSEKVAAIAGRHTAEKYGWKVGGRLHVSSPHYFLAGIDLHLVGIYDSPDQESYLVYHWDYLNDVLGSPNTTDLFWVLAGSERDMPVLMKSVDEEFRNMGTPTLSQTVKQMVLNFLSWLGNLRLLLLSVSGAVVFTVLLILANTMAMSVRERTVELAVLRTLGYPLRQVLVILTGESLALAIAGAALGCLLAWALCRAVTGYAIGGGLRVELSVGWAGASQALGVAAFTAFSARSCLLIAPGASASPRRCASSGKFARSCSCKIADSRLPFEPSSCNRLSGVVCVNPLPSCVDSASVALPCFCCSEQPPCRREWKSPAQGVSPWRQSHQAQGLFDERRCGVMIAYPLVLTIHKL